MKTTGFLRVSRRLAPGISIGTVTRGRSAGFLAAVALLGAASSKPAPRPVATIVPVGASSRGSLPTAIFVALALVAGVLIGCAIGAGS